MRTIVMLAFTTLITLALVELCAAEVDPEEDRFFWNLFRPNAGNQLNCRRCVNQNSYHEECCRNRNRCCTFRWPTKAPSAGKPASGSSGSASGSSGSASGSTGSASGSSGSASGSSGSASGSAGSDSGSAGSDSGSAASGSKK